MKMKSIAALFSLALAFVVSSTAQTVDSLPITDLFEPYGVAVDHRTGLVYLNDGSNDQILRFDPTDKTVAVYATLAPNSSPEGIVVYNDATLGVGIAVSVSADATIRFYGIDSATTAILAGTPGVRGGANGPGATATFASPSGLAVASDGTLYVADLGGNSIRLIAHNAAHDVTTLSVPGVKFKIPAAVAVSAAGDVYVADTGNNSVKKIVGGVVVSDVAVTSPRGLLWLGGKTGLLIAGDDHAITRAFGVPSGLQLYSGQPGTAGFTDGPLGSALFNQPAGFALDDQGQVLIADLKNDRIRRINRLISATPTVTPSTATYTNAIVLGVSVPLPDKTPGSVFHFTIDGSDPTDLSSVLPVGYVVDGGPVPLKLRAFNSDFGASSTVSNNYTFAVSPLSFEVDGGFFVRSNDVPVAVKTATVGTTLRFTTDGSPPTAGSQVWTDRTIATNTTLQLMGFKGGYADSALLSNKFAFQVNKPVIRPSTNSSANDITVNIETLTVGARIFYTTDLSIPSSTNPTATEATNKVGFTLKKKGEMRVIAERPGYSDSDRTDETFLLKVATPVIHGAATNSDNVIHITFTSETVGAKFYYTTNDALPDKTTGFAYNPATGFDLDQKSTLKVAAFREGADDNYEPSAVAEQAFSLVVGKPIINSFPASADTNITVTVRTTTLGAKIHWIVEGDPKSTNAVEVAVDGTGSASFVVSKTGTLSVIAVRDGFAASEIVTAPVVLKVANPVIAVTPVTVPAINKVTIGLTTTTPGGILKYTLDGTSPLAATALTYGAPFVVDTNATLTVAAVKTDYLSSDIASKTLVIQADTPVMTPPGGFFQDGTTLTFTVARTAGTVSAGTESTVYYTLDGSEPTVTSPKYSGPFKINKVNFPSGSLRLVRAKAFAEGVLASDIVAGTLSETNKIGIAREITYGGSGATVFVPVVLSLSSNVELKSLQYRVQVWPKSAGAPNLALGGLTSTGWNTNSFVQIFGSLDGTVTPSAVIGSQTTGAIKTNDIAIAFLANASNLRMREFGTIGLFKIKVPGSALAGTQYGIRILEASGTADSLETRVVFGTTVESERTIEVKNIAYTAGDTSPGAWYNAGDYGDGDLDNSDVNNAYYASFGQRLPDSDSDVFNAMDVYPVEDPVLRAINPDLGAGGDGSIRFLDWNIILQRALRLSNNNYTRYWTNGFDLPFSVRVASLTRSPLGEGEIIRRKDVATRWFRPANVEAAVRQSAEPGATVNVPVVLEVKTGFSVAGMQFGAIIESSDASLSAPAMVFTKSASLSSGIPASELPVGQVGYAWAVGGVNFASGVHTLGTISFSVPSAAKAGTIFTVRFTNVDGAENIDTQYDFESIRGTVIVSGTLPPNPFGRLTDEWMMKYFGSRDNPAAYAAADADGDGISNWNEYVSGANPTELRFHRLADEWSTHSRDGFHLRYFAAPDKTYSIDAAADAGGPWNSLSEGVIGDGSLKDYVDSDGSDRTKFYRLRAVPR